MLRLAFDQRRLSALAARRRLPTHALDTGTIVHGALRELFGPEDPPGPFAVQEHHRGALGAASPRHLAVLAYTSRTLEELRDHKDRYADPGVHALCDWDTMAVKGMPEAWPTGARVGFAVRACPVVRVPRAGRSGHDELDAVLAAARREPENHELDREEVYRGWLAGELARRGGVTSEGLRVERFQLEKVVRPRHDEAGTRRAMDRPDVTFEGTLTVTDGALFNALLARGLGRHRAFGFGMVLLKPPGARA
ncbi:MAG: type I-E CRISPR-associated protein Cas6/Cse3/CasE [Deltaproteobacteria bacterium]|nr:type I-E CRISPR-associated protein Cas6/Cse3/CasE [Deltaproteobacteria bacterium]